jgi:HAD superfamily hydrolase (TIGR01549 family)
LAISSVITDLSLRRATAGLPASGAGKLTRMSKRKAAILDIDGTLVDTNYQHAVAWYMAFRQHDLDLPVWRIHRHLGMGGDQFVAALAGDRFEHESGDQVRAAHDALYLASIESVAVIAGARELIVDLKDRGHPVVLASSASAHEADHYLDLLDARELVDAWTTAEDVEQTKPSPDLVKAALAKIDCATGVMVGDTPWDVHAAKRGGVPTIAVLTGGFAAEELREAGAVNVFESINELRGKLAETPLA